MPTNKNAAICYQTLGKCFRDRFHRYYIEELIDKCEEALLYYNGIGGVCRRQIFEDIKFMESDTGWSIPLERIKDGKKVYYRYYDSQQIIDEDECTLCIEEEMLNNRILQINAEKSRENNIREIARRYDTMPVSFWEDYKTMDEHEQIERIMSYTQPTPPTKRIRQASLQTKTKLPITNAEDIDHYLEDLRQQLLKLLVDHDGMMITK